jgi:hypothetical protein
VCRLHVYVTQAGLEQLLRPAQADQIDAWVEQSPLRPRDAVLPVDVPIRWLVLDATTTLGQLSVCPEF